MEFLIGAIVILAAVWFLSSRSLEKPVAQWSDDELQRRLPKYQNLLTAQMQARDWNKTNETKAKIDEICGELAKRARIFAQQHMDSLRTATPNGAEPKITASFIAAAESGNAELLAMVGEAYFHGTHGLTKDPKMAHQYLQRAADREHAHAAFLLAGMYLSGNGVLRNQHIARLYANKAKQFQHPDAKALLADIHRAFPE